MLLLKIFGVFAFILTSGSFSNKSKPGATYWMQQSANFIALLGAMYLIRDVWNDISSLTSTATVPNTPLSNEKPFSKTEVFPQASGFDLRATAILTVFCLISALLAMYRGVVREILSITSWICAGFVILYVIQKDLASAIGLPQVFLLKTGFVVIVFISVLIIVHLIVSRASDTLLDSPVSVWDRALGFVFGAARGIFILFFAGGLASTLGLTKVFGDPSAPMQQPYAFAYRGGKLLRDLIAGHLL